jgi:hypothetical protein
LFSRVRSFRTSKVAVEPAGRGESGPAIEQEYGITCPRSVYFCLFSSTSRAPRIEIGIILSAKEFDAAKTPEP